jgi:hypothetical protein
MLGRVRVKRINQNVRVNNPRLNGHRRKVRGDGMSLSRRDARLAGGFGFVEMNNDREGEQAMADLK